MRENTNWDSALSTAILASFRFEMSKAHLWALTPLTSSSSGSVTTFFFFSLIFFHFLFLIFLLRKKKGLLLWFQWTWGAVTMATESQAPPPPADDNPQKPGLLFLLILPNFGFFWFVNLIILMGSQSLYKLISKIYGI